MRNWYIISFLILGGIPSLAQSSPDDATSKKIISKIELFGTLSWMYPKTYFEPSVSEREFKLGRSIGVSLTHSFTSRFELQGSIGVTEKRYVNTEINPQNRANRITGDQKNDYISVSVIPKFLFGNRNLFNVGLGSYVSFLQNSQRKLTYYDPNNPNVLTGTIDSKDLYKNYDAGLTIRFGVEIPIKKKYAINLQIVSNNGLANVNENTIPSVISIEKYNTIEFLAGMILIK
ncbi:MAG TPA: outer membrane beta-barrel protein [Cyclobacteriaceae bacterium]|nr:outer membrane beta-barrel protein [Cyclobacteriaceae bacterium]